jgi:hypothetical protein
MDQSNRLLLWFVALLIVCLGINVALPLVLGVKPNAGPSQRLRNLSQASIVEVRDGLGRGVLRGHFQARAAQPGDELRAAHLVSDNDLTVGKAEIELTRHPNGALVQELEVDVNGLDRDSLFTVVVDGVTSGTFRTDPFGGGELELYGRVPDVRARTAD